MFPFSRVPFWDTYLDPRPNGFSSTGRPKNPSEEFPGLAGLEVHYTGGPQLGSLGGGLVVKGLEASFLVSLNDHNPPPHSKPKAPRKNGPSEQPHGQILDPVGGQSFGLVGVNTDAVQFGSNLVSAWLPPIC